MGFFESNLEDIFNMDNYQSVYCFDTIGHTVEKVLLKAKAESRLVIGLPAAIKVLTNKPDGSLICLMAEPQHGDSATHMIEVLMEAFCFENDIYVIKVDSAKKLGKILGENSMENCCLIQKRVPRIQNKEELTKFEDILVDHCEEFWDLTVQPIIKLP